MTTLKPKIEVSLSEAEIIFNALSDQNRLRILFLMYRLVYILSVDVEKIFGFSNTKANRHLHYLKNSGLLLQKKLDQYVIHTLSPKYSLYIALLFDDIYDQQLIKDFENYKALFKEKKLSMERWFVDPGIRGIYEKNAAQDSAFRIRFRDKA